MQMAQTLAMQIHNGPWEFQCQMPEIRQIAQMRKVFHRSIVIDISAGNNEGKRVKRCEACQVGEKIRELPSQQRTAQRRMVCLYNRARGVAEVRAMHFIHHSFRSVAWEIDTGKGKIGSVGAAVAFDHQANRLRVRVMGNQIVERRNRWETKKANFVW